MSRAVWASEDCVVSVSGTAAVFFSSASGMAVGEGLEVVGVGVALVVVGEGVGVIDGVADVLREAAGDGVVAELVVSGVLPVMAWIMPTMIARAKKRTMIPRHPRQERTPPFATLFWGSLTLVWGSLREGMKYLSIQGISIHIL